MGEVQDLARLEALLFVAGDPLAVEELARLLEKSEEEVRGLLEQLKRRYQRDPLSGLVLRELENAAALATAPEHKELVEAFFGKTRDQKLTDAAYETLAVIAYNAPATRAEIETVRGVDSDSVVARLIERGLVREVGVLDAPGRPALLDVTEQFLLDFGLKSAKELPPVDLLMYETVTRITEGGPGDSARQAAPRPLVIAIDGPSGSGKSTVARLLSEHLGILTLDTGAMYRALGYKALRSGIKPSDAEAVRAMLTSTSMEIDLSDRVQKTLVDGEDMMPYIRTPEVAKAASDISTLPVCRDYCVRIQRELGKRQALILEGRDIGTYVFPDAPVKFFITASAEARAERRLKDLEKAGVQTSMEEVLKEMEKRDRQDAERELAPARRAEDAILIDSSKMSATEVVEAMIDLIRQKEREQPMWRAAAEDGAK
ncbi:MAG TPA: (d)CMP kinase [Bacillota bacterium]|jgi:cytidylate kinase|nr:(d)CMP kinase [Fastidiosipila sp.]HPX93911.1 (d)CMP kinase [Bacillota bacterium]HQB81807.1 (d)CMP kinase [Bacillota bacterium]